MQPGVYSDIPNAAYHSGPGVSKSMLDILRNQSPLHLHHRMTAANDNDATRAQEFGTAFHALLLEPEKFTAEYAPALRREDHPDAIDDREVLAAMVAKLNESRQPKIAATGSKAELVDRIMEHCAPADRAELEAMKGADLKAIIDKANESRAGLLSTSGSRHDLAALLRANGVDVTLWSDVHAKWLETVGDRIALTETQWDELHRMRDAVMAHPAARALLKKRGVAEHSVYWKDPLTGVLCRCRPDWWLMADGIVVDVKTAHDASPEGFARSIANWRYHVAHPFYVDGINEMRKQAMEYDDHSIAPVRSFVFLTVEKTPPYAVGVYMLDAASVELGRLEYRQDLARFSDSQTSGVWPGYGDAVQSISLPQWKLKSAADLLDKVA